VLLSAPLHHASNSTYDSFGNQLTATDPLRRTRTFAYDALNRRISTTSTRTLPSGARETITTLQSYDAAGHPTVTTDPYGATTAVSYNALGKPATVTGKNGAVTTYAQNTLGLLERIAYADVTSVSYTYDSEGHTLGETDQGGHVTTYTYDALGRRRRETHSDSSSVETSYDATGRVQTRRDERGNTTTHTYARHQEIITDALTNPTQRDLNADGQPARITDALGRVTRNTYDLGSIGHGEGRLGRVDFHGGSYGTYVYDCAGRKTRETYAE
jgi:YD repeat-containing protein